MKRFKENRKAVSPVISTIIIVAVAIAISIAVAFWLGGITSIFTRFEKLEIPTAYATNASYKIGSNVMTGWNITLNVKNTGTTDTTIDSVLINGIPASEIVNVTVTFDGGLWINNATVESISTFIKSGVSIDIIIGIPRGPYISGQSITITLHTSGGQDYPKTVVLP
ncbi:DUF4352 domain-containing protein [Candidatus Bathyarchaeota archaeon]|nr:DUF4352 domain-containing protein [Candidatus Bathyarchaeota archaeon]